MKIVEEETCLYCSDEISQYFENIYPFYEDLLENSMDISEKNVEVITKDMIHTYPIKIKSSMPSLINNPNLVKKLPPYVRHIAKLQHKCGLIIKGLDSDEKYGVFEDKLVLLNHELCYELLRDESRIASIRCDLNLQ